MNDQAKGFLITTLGVLFVVPDALFGRLIEAPPADIAFWRNILSGSMLLIVLLIFQGLRPFRSALSAGPSAWVYALLSGSSGILFMFAVNMTSVANVVFIIAAMPAFAALFSWLLMGEAPSKRTIITMVIVAFGLMIVTSGGHEGGVAHWSGDLIALSVAACFALALTLARKARAANLLPMAGVGYILATLFIIPFVNPIATITAQPLTVIIHGAVFIFGSLTFLALGPRYITAPEVSLLILLESILAPLLVWAVIGEFPGQMTLIGGAIILIALFVSNIIALRRSRQAS